MPKKKREEKEGSGAVEEEDDESKIKRKRLEPIQLEKLEVYFQKDIYPSTELKEQLANELQLKSETVSKWFINRRVKHRAELLNAADPNASASALYHKQKKAKALAVAAGEQPPVITAVGKSVPSTKITISLKGKKGITAVLPAEEKPVSVETSAEKQEEAVVPPKEEKRRGRKPGWKKKLLALSKEELDDESIEQPGDSSFNINLNKPHILPSINLFSQIMDEDDISMEYLTSKPTVEENEFWDTYKKENLDVSEQNISESSTSVIELIEGDAHSKELEEINKLPLWKQLWLKSKDVPIKAELRESSEQEILAYIKKTRRVQHLLPIFAMITGPTILSYRMEELRIVLGRITPFHRDADIHIGDSNRISHTHCLIEYNRRFNKYFIINLSKNGIKILEDDVWVEHRDRSPVPLKSTITQVDIQGVKIFIQLFYIAEKNIKHKSVVSEKLKQKHKEKEKKAKAKDKDKEKDPNKAKRPVPQYSKSYSSMILAALRALGGKGTFKEITHFIQENFKGDLEDRRTWKNSVGGVLSANPQFESVPLPEDENPELKRGRGSLWKLKNYKLEDHQVEDQQGTVISDTHKDSTPANIDVGDAMEE